MRQMEQDNFVSSFLRRCQRWLFWMMIQILGWITKLYRKQQKQTSQTPKTISLESVDDQVKEVVRSRTGLKGIRNIGNTCYMNSALQCLSNSAELSFLMSELKAHHIKPASNIARDYKGFIMEQWQSKSAMIISSPEVIKRHISQFNSHFKGSGQKDSAELLATLLDALNEETKEQNVDPPQKYMLEEKDLQKYSEQELSQFYANKYKARNNSIITQLFAGQLKTEITCNHCKTSTNYLENNINSGFKVFDSFTILYLPIQKQQNKQHCLKQCLKDFSKEQKLTDVNAWYCKQCQKDTPSTKITTLYEPNRFIIFGLKRFKDNEKIEQKVDFDLEINISQHCTKLLLDKQKSKLVYELYGVINHSGGMGWGHYTAVCKNFIDHSWYQFNDSIVRPILKKQIVSSLAYVLLYRRKD